MGMVIIEESGNFDPALFGLEIGDVIQVDLVGGGGGGDGYCSGSAMYSEGGDAGSGGSNSGGGSGGGYGSGGGGGGYNGRGGGGGGYLKRLAIKLTALDAVPVTIGAKGAGRKTVDTPPTAGGTTSFGAYGSALGGNPGNESAGGIGGTNGGRGKNGGGGGGGGGFIIGHHLRSNGGDGGILSNAGYMTDGGDGGYNGGGGGCTARDTSSLSGDTLKTSLQAIQGGRSRYGGYGADAIAANSTTDSGLRGGSAGPGHGVCVVYW